MKKHETKLSVNVNKIATLRNARGKNTPDLLELTCLLIESGAESITIHPRPDGRHIRRKDVYDLKNLLKNYSGKVEFNIEGYPSDSFLRLIADITPSQCTLVPDPPNVLTSNAGWKLQENKTLLKSVINTLKSLSVRVSLFIDPFLLYRSGLKFEDGFEEIPASAGVTKMAGIPSSSQFSNRTGINETEFSALKELAPHRIELYTEKYAESWSTPKKRKAVLETYRTVAQKVSRSGIGINAGHDLNQKNLPDLLKHIPEIKEISIGQAFIADSLKEGMPHTLKSYLNIIRKSQVQANRI